MSNINIGDLVSIRCKSSQYCDEWGRVTFIDDDYYYVALWDGKNSSLVFDKNDLKKKK